MDDFEIYKVPKEKPKKVPKIKKIEDLEPDVLNSLKLYLIKITEDDFVGTANQKDVASIMNALIDLLKLIISKSTNTNSDDDTKKLEEFKKILRGKA